MDAHGGIKMKKLSLISLIAALGGCCYAGNGAAEPATDASAAKPDYALALDCTDWRVYADVSGNAATVTAENIYTPQETIFPLQSFNAELTWVADAPYALSGIADQVQYGVTLEFPHDPSADPVYGFVVTDTSDRAASRSHRYLCKPIFPSDE
jgi:hypothetical protein